MIKAALMKNDSRSGRAPADGERGYALLSLLLALSIISLYLVSSVAPNVKMSVQRTKEQEMIYRGNQMAKAIARYYGSRRLLPLNLIQPPAYGYLTELKKLKEGVTLNVTEIKFARGSEMIDPMAGIEWEPVRARDPRINPVLQAYAAETGAIISLPYLLLAGAPARKQSIFGNSDSQSSSSSSQSGTRPGQPGQPSGQAGVNPKPGEDPDEPDNDDDDDSNDPLAHLFEQDSNAPGKSTVPIIGVAPKLRGKSVVPLRLGDVALNGIENYEQWVFIYIPPQGFMQGPGQGPGQGLQPVQPPPRGRLPVSQ
jgi:type II secretory pathway pseudopilin PulG